MLVQIQSACPNSGCKSAVDGRAWNSEDAGSIPAALTISPSGAHTDVHSPDKREAASANLAGRTKYAGAHGARHRCQRSMGQFDSVRPLQLPWPKDGREPSKLTMYVRVVLRAPFCLGGGHSRASYAQRREFESPQGSQTCVRGGTGIRTTLRASALWVRLPPNAPDDVRSTGVRVSLISSRELQIRVTAGFESLTDDHILPAEGMRHAPSEGVLRWFNSSSGGQFADQAETAQQVLGKDEMQGAIPWFGSNLPFKL